MIKVDEIGQNKKNIAYKKIQNGCDLMGKGTIGLDTYVRKQLPTRPFSLTTPQLDEAMDQSENPLP